MAQTLGRPAGSGLQCLDSGPLLDVEFYRSASALWHDVGTQLVHVPPANTSVGSKLQALVHDVIPPNHRHNCLRHRSLESASGQFFSDALHDSKHVTIQSAQIIPGLLCLISADYSYSNTNLSSTRERTIFD